MHLVFCQGSYLRGRGHVASGVWLVKCEGLVGVHQVHLVFCLGSYLGGGD